jgi:GntR family transcriptional regulator
MKFTIDHNSYIPLHVQIEKMLREMAKDSQYQKNQLFPTESSLSKILSVSRNTVRAGIEKLVNDGILERKRGIGTRVISNVPRVSHLKAWESFTKEMQLQGIDTETFFLEYKELNAPMDVSKIFSVEPKTPIYCLERIKGFEGVPVVHFLSYFHPRLELNGREDFSAPLYEILEKTCHVIADTSKEKIKAVAADSLISEKLHVKKGDPVLRRERIVTDKGGRIIEYAVNHYRSDKFEYTIDIRRG